MSDTSSKPLTDEDLVAIRDRLNEKPINRVFPYPITDYRCDALTLLAEVERLRAALTRIIERYEQTQAGSHGDEALLPLDHWNLPRAMQQEARDALGLPAMSEETTR